MDETGQPVGAPPGVNGTPGANGKGDHADSRLSAWAPATPGRVAADCPEAEYADPVPGADYPSSWSATGSGPEPPTEPVGHTWRGEPVYRRIVNRHRYTDMLSPFRTASGGSPPAGTPTSPAQDAHPHPYEGEADRPHHTPPPERTAGRPLMPIEPPPPPPDFSPWSQAPAPRPDRSPDEVTTRLSSRAAPENRAVPDDRVAPESPAAAPTSGAGGSPHFATPPLPPQHVPPQHVPPPGQETVYDTRPTPPQGVRVPGRPINGSMHHADRWQPHATEEQYAGDPYRGEGYLAGRSSAPTADPDPSTADQPDEGDGLPQRVPGEPDVPTVPGAGAGETAETDESAAVPELTRIATYLRHDEATGRPVRRETLDTEAVLDAVRGVAGVRDAQLRPNAGGVHSLRLDLAEGADAAQVSREVARLLKERLGLAAAVGTPAAQAVGGSTGYSGRRRVTSGAVQGRAPVESRTGEAPSFAVPDRASRPLSRPEETVRLVLDQVLVSTSGLDAKVEVSIGAGERRAAGEAHGPAVDGYVLRLAAAAAAAAVDRLLVEEGTGTSRGRCFVEHTAVVPLGTCEVAVVVVQLMCCGWVDQLSGSAVVAGDPRQAAVRATLDAVNRRVEALLP